MRIRFEHCRLVSPGIDIPDGTLAVSEDRIESAGNQSLSGAFDRTLDMRGLIAAPGFIDIHSHGRSNFDFCDGTAEAFETIGRGKLQDGVTGFLATSLTVPRDDLRTLCRIAKDYAENVRDGAGLLGIHLEGPFINPECAGAQNPAFLKKPDIALVDEMNSIFPVKKVTFSPELEGGFELTSALASRGIMPSGGHSKADYECFVRNRNAGMKHLTHFCNAMTPLHHLRFGMVGGGLMSDDVFVEMICDGVHLCDPMIQMIAKLKTAERMMLITDSMRAAAMPDGKYLLGGLPVTVKNGRATLESGVVAGSTLRYFNGLGRLVRLTGLPLCEAIRTTSLNQALSLNLGLRGKLEKNYFADIVFLDGELKPRMTVRGGKILWENR